MPFSTRPERLGSNPTARQPRHSAAQAATTPTGRLLQLASALDLYLTPAGEASVLLDEPDGAHVRRLDSPAVREWLLLRYHERCDDVPPARCLEEVMALLHARARLFDRPGPEVEEDPREIAPLIAGIKALLAVEPTWSGTVRDLKDVLEAFAPESLHRRLPWLTSPGALGNRLRRLQDRLEEEGIAVAFDYMGQPRWSVRLERHSLPVLEDPFTVDLDPFADAWDSQTSGASEPATPGGGR